MKKTLHLDIFQNRAALVKMLDYSKTLLLIFALAQKAS